MQASPPQEYSTRYQGRNLLFLLLAMGTPAALLYLRLVFGYVATETHVTPAASHGLALASNLALLLFAFAQLICAGYVQRLLRPARRLSWRALQYIGVLLLCTLCSVVGAVLLEAFGYVFFLRLKNGR